MATFFGGEQLSELVLIKTTGIVSSGAKSLMYTVPNGFYAIVEFVHCGSNFGYYLTSFRIDVFDVDDTDILSSGVNISDGSFYSKFGERLNLFFNSGTKFYRVNDSFASQDLKAEIHLRLYKKPWT